MDWNNYYFINSLFLNCQKKIFQTFANLLFALIFAAPISSFEDPPLAEMRNLGDQVLSLRRVEKSL